MRRFEGRVALITGASRGIGLAVAERLVSEGATVVITGRKPESLTAAVERLDAIDAGHAVGVAGKADDPEHRADVFAQISERFGRLDHLVNNAGINPAYGPALEIESSVVRKILEVNVVAALDWTRSAVDAGLSRSIVNTASVAGLSASPGVAFYGVSKAALLNLTQQLAVELAPRHPRQRGRPRGGPHAARAGALRGRPRGRARIGLPARPHRRARGRRRPGRVPALRRRRVDHRSYAHHRRRRQCRRRRLDA